MTNSVVAAKPASPTHAAIALPPLPYGYTELQPVLSEATMRTHHDKHHARYVETLNRLLSEGSSPVRSANLLSVAIPVRPLSIYK